MPAIEIKNLYKSFGKVPALVEENLTVDEGEFFGFVGPNGSGKSTTIRILLNYLHPTRGSAKVFGMDSVKESVGIRRVSAYIPSEADFFGEMRAGELIEYAARLRHGKGAEKAEELCELFEVNRQRSIGKMSFGNRKKLLLVTALMSSPRLLLLDEATVGLDALTKKRFKDYLVQENKKGTTVFFCSHDMAEVQELCQRMAIIRNGSILEVAHVNAISASDAREVRLKTDEDISALLSFFHIGSVTRLADYIRFTYKGDVNALVQALGNYQLDDLQISLPTLEDAMVRYYEKKLEKEEEELAISQTIHDFFHPQ